MKNLLLSFLTIVLFGVFANALSYSTAHVTGTGTVTADETTMTGDNYTVTLPACGTSNDGETHIFKSVETNTAYTEGIVPNGTDTLESVSAYWLAPSQSVTLSCNGPAHNWVAVAYW